MGNSGFAKAFSSGNIAESKYRCLYDINAVEIDKNEIPLSKFKGKVTLCVKVSSLHAEAPTEIAELKELQSRFTKTEFEILAFPCNQFPNEPGNLEAIKQNYFSKYGVSFPVFVKLEVKGPYTHPAYKFLRRYRQLYNTKQLFAEPITQDFSKFLVDAEGNVIGCYPRGTKVDVLTAEVRNIFEEKKEAAKVKTELIKEVKPR